MRSFSPRSVFVVTSEVRQEGNVLAARGLSVSPSGRGVMGPRGSKGMIREQVTTCSAPLKCCLSPTALVTAIALATSPWQRAASKKAETGRLQTGFGGSRRWLGGRLWTNTYLPVWRGLGPPSCSSPSGMPGLEEDLPGRLQ